MGFDVNKFTAASFKDRTQDIPVPRLSSFFDKEEKPVWTVRGLDGVESAKARQAVLDAKNIEIIVDAIGSTVPDEKLEAIKEIAGVGSDDDVPEDLVRRYSMLVQGSVSPECTQPMAIKLAKNFCEDFYNLTNHIIQLTGRGRVGE